MGLGEEVNMKFSIEDLNKMTKAQLVKVITDLYDEVDEHVKKVNSTTPKGSIHFGGSPKWAKEYHDKVLRELRTDIDE